MAKLAESEGTSTGGLAKINNVLMQMRKNCNHPDLITSAFTADLDYPPPAVLVAQAGKMGLMDRLLRRLKAGGHKVLIFSQVRHGRGTASGGVCQACRLGWLGSNLLVHTMQANLLGACICFARWTAYPACLPAADDQDAGPAGVVLGADRPQGMPH